MAIAFVNAAAGQNASATLLTTLATSAFSATAGNLIVVAVRQATDQTLPSSVVDTALNTYVHIAGADSAISGTNLLSLWYAFNIAGNGSNIVTANWAAGHAFSAVLARQYSGLATATNPLDKVASGSSGAAGTTATSASFNTAQASEAIVAFVSTNQLTQGFVLGTIGGTAATNLNADAGSGSEMTAGEDLIVTTQQTAITATVTFNSGTWEISVATFNAPLVDTAVETLNYSLS